MKKNIIFVNGHLNVGGVEKSLIDVLKHFDYEQYNVDLLLFEDLGDYYNDLPSSVNVIFMDITKTYGSFIGCIKELLKERNYTLLLMKIIMMFSSKIDQRLLRLAKPLIKINKHYDVAIAYRVGFCAEVVAHCVNSKKKICWWHHGEINYDEKMISRISDTYKCFDNIISVSQGCKEMIDNCFSNITSKTSVISNMIDIDEIQALGKQFNPYASIDRTSKIIVSVGRLSKEKNFINVVNISKNLIESGFHDFIWYIVGEGLERNNIEEQININKLNHHVILVGNQVNPYPFMANADIMVHPSLVESQCITVLESMSLGKI